MYIIQLFAKELFKFCNQSSAALSPPVKVCMHMCNICLCMFCLSLSSLATLWTTVCVCVCVCTRCTSLQCMERQACPSPTTWGQELLQGEWYYKDNIHTYIHTYIHTHIHTYILNRIFQMYEHDAEKPHPFLYTKYYRTFWYACRVQLWCYVCIALTLHCLIYKLNSSHSTRKKSEIERQERYISRKLHILVS